MVISSPELKFTKKAQTELCLSSNCWNRCSALHYLDQIGIHSGYFSSNLRGQWIVLRMFSKFLCFKFKNADKALVEVLDVFVH